MKTCTDPVRNNVSILACPCCRATIDATVIGSIALYFEQRLGTDCDSSFEQGPSCRCEIKPGICLRIAMLIKAVRCGIPTFRQDGGSRMSLSVHNNNGND